MLLDFEGSDPSWRWTMTGFVLLSPSGLRFEYRFMEDKHGVPTLQIPYYNLNVAAIWMCFATDVKINRTIFCEKIFQNRLELIFNKM